MYRFLILETRDSPISKSLDARQVTLVVVSLFSAFALTLSVVGVYAILARLVTSRTREIGTRVAISAQVSDVIRIVFWQGIKIVSVGLMLGLTAALLFGRFLSDFLYGITSSDPVSIVFGGTVVSVGRVLGMSDPDATCHPHQSGHRASRMMRFSARRSLCRVRSRSG